VIEAAKDCRTVINSSSYGSVEWKTYSAATFLLRNMSRALLPDVSSLPMEAAAEMRECLKPPLDPMRAEMLRFTEDLRKIVEDECSISEIEREADNLIASRVKPVVREAAARSDELARKRWRKLYVGAAKAFGLFGPSYLDPKLLAKAVQQTLETGSLAFVKPEDERSPQPRATAQFVLEAGRFCDIN